jgi:hypothetical protein
MAMGARLPFAAADAASSFLITPAHEHIYLGQMHASCLAPNVSAFLLSISLLLTPSHAHATSARRLLTSHSAPALQLGVVRVKSEPKLLHLGTERLRHAILVHFVLSASAIGAAR